MIDFDFNKECYGCRNCENICPFGAISIKESLEGFLEPIIDINKCQKCGLCEKMCPRLANIVKTNLNQKEWYGIFSKNKNNLNNSTSGGIFPELAEYFIKNNNYVCGCIWGADMVAQHVVTNSLEQVRKMRGSKYVQSNLKDVLKECKKISKNAQILFTGTPCQIAAAKLYLGNNDNMFYLGLICEGAGSNKVWQNYKKELEKKVKSKMTCAYFRKKDICWDTPVALYEFENGKKIKNLSFSYDYYMRGFLKGIYYRNSCFNCQYKGNNHNSDILIGDLWGCSNELRSKSNSMGVSLMIINTTKGEELFKKLKEKFEYELVDPNYYMSHNKLLMEPLKKPKQRDEFYKNLDNEKFKTNIQNCIKENKIKFLTKNILYKIKLFKVMKNLKYKIK